MLQSNGLRDGRQSSRQSWRGCPYRACFEIGRQSGVSARDETRRTPLSGERMEEGRGLAPSSGNQRWTDLNTRGLLTGFRKRCSCVRDDTMEITSQEIHITSQPWTECGYHWIARTLPVNAGVCAAGSPPKPQCTQRRLGSGVTQAEKVSAPA